MRLPWIGPQIEAHPQRDRLVEILKQREAQIKAAVQQANKAQQTAQPKVGSIKPKADQQNVPKATVVASKRPPVQPDPTIVRPSWTFLQPLVA